MTGPRDSTDEIEERLRTATGARRRLLLAELALTLTGRDPDRAASLARDALDEIDESDPPQTELQARFALARVAANRGDAAGAISGAEDALALPGARVDPRSRFGLHELLSRCWAVGGSIDRAHVHAGAVNSIAETLDEDEFIARAACVEGFVALRTCDYEAARAAFERTLEHADDEHVLLQAEALCWLGIIADHAGRSKQAIELLARSLSRAVAGGAPGAVTRARTNLAVIYESVGELEKARGHLTASLAIARERSDRRAVGIMMANLGRIDRAEGALDSAIRNLEAALAIASDMGDVASEVAARQALGTTLLDRGDPDGAEEQFSAVIALESQTPQPYFVAHAVLGRARVLDARGDLVAAIAMFEDSVRLMFERADKSGQGRALYRLASAQLRAGDASGARAAIARARPIAESLDTTSLLDDLTALESACGGGASEPAPDA